MNIKDKAILLIQVIAINLGYQIHRVPNLDTTLTPPGYLRRLVGPSVSPEAYQAVGEEFLTYFKDLCGLKPSEDILDVGCGCGRMAAQLAKYLNKSATYEGFDIEPISIKWCETNISARYPNFHFRLANVFNKAYNPMGKLKASKYRFPYKDECFAFVFLTSVFTHMLPQEMENYLSEISRVLRKGQRCLCTYFILNAQSLALIDEKLSALKFNYVFGNYRTISKTTPEAAVAYAEEYILELYDKYGLQIIDTIKYGSWCGRKEFLSYQDIIVAVKV